MINKVTLGIIAVVAIAVIGFYVLTATNKGAALTTVPVTIPLAASSSNPYCLWVNHSADLAQFCLYVTGGPASWTLSGNYDPPVSGTPYTCTTTSPTAYPSPCGNTIHAATIVVIAGSGWTAPDGIGAITYGGGYSATLVVN